MIDRGDNYCYNDKHITTYKCTKLACCTPKIYTMLYVKYISIKKEIFVLEFSGTLRLDKSVLL